MFVVPKRSAQMEKKHKNRVQICLEKGAIKAMNYDSNLQRLCCRVTPSCGNPFYIVLKSVLGVFNKLRVFITWMK